MEQPKRLLTHKNKTIAEPQPAPKRAGFFVSILLPKENVADCLAVHRIRDIHDSLNEKLRKCLCINNVAMS